MGKEKFAFEYSWFFLNTDAPAGIPGGSSSSQSGTDVKAMEDREAAVAQKEQDNLAERKALEDQKSTLAQQEKENAANQKKLEARDDGLTRKEKGLSADRKALEDREAELAEKEHDQSARWDKKMKELQDLQESLAAKQKKSAHRDSASVGCGYKHYKPPRKINKKVIGLVYEK